MGSCQSSNSIASPKEKKATENLRNVSTPSTTATVSPHYQPQGQNWFSPIQKLRSVTAAKPTTAAFAAVSAAVSASTSPISHSTTDSSNSTAPDSELQLVLQQQQIEYSERQERARRARKVQDRNQEVDGYKQLWKEFQQIQQQIKAPLRRRLTPAKSYTSAGSTTSFRCDHFGDSTHSHFTK